MRQMKVVAVLVFLALCGSVRAEQPFFPGDGVVLNIVDDPFNEVIADAVVVPQYPGILLYAKEAKILANGGELGGLIAYEQLVDTGLKPRLGQAVITPSHGGMVKHLIYDFGEKTELPDHRRVDL